jgi:hypothetical protein
MQSTMYDKLLLLPLFQGLCKEDFTAILEKVRLHFQKYTAGSCIVKQGDYCNNIIFILQGETRAESADQAYTIILSTKHWKALKSLSLTHCLACIRNIRHRIMHTPM